MSDETRGIDPYDAVLSDLRAKRNQIDQAIAAIESLRSGRIVTPENGASPPANGNQNPSADARIDGPGDLLGMSIADAAKKLLANKRTTLKNPEIATLFKAGGLMLNSKDWTNTIGAVLTRRSNEVGDIVKIGRGTWGLKEWYPNRNFKKDKDLAKGTEEVVTEVEPTA